MASEPSKELQQWDRFFLFSLQQNLNLKDFRAALQTQSARCPLRGTKLIETWAGSRDRGSVVRPRYMKYFETLLHAHLVTDEDAILYVLRNFKKSVEYQEEQMLLLGDVPTDYRLPIEAAILERLAYQLVNFRVATVPPGDRVPSIRIFKPLISLLFAYVEELSGSAPLSGPALEIAQELGKFVAAYINDLSLLGLLTSHDGGVPIAFRRGFGRVLTPFTTLLAPTNAELSESLGHLQRQFSIFVPQDSESVEDGLTNDLNALSYQESVQELPLIATKAALYIYLNAMVYKMLNNLKLVPDRRQLCGRPIADDPALFNFLNARYNESVPSLIADLIAASFDALANAVNRTEQQGSINIYRSFISNKLPTLLVSFSSLIFPPLTVETCLTDALNRLDPSGDPFTAQTFDPLSITGILSDARQEFLFACALHGLIPESSIESILGDVPMQSLPESGKYIKSELVQQCSTNPGRIKDLIGELENMEGNSAEIVAALVEIIQTLCSNKDTMTLKSVCNALSCKSSLMDVMLIFVEPVVILGPLCGLLENWQNQEDQSESHPVYEEFGSIVLLVFAFRHHFNLQESDLGIGPSDSFLRTYFQNARTPRRPNDLTETERQRLGGWIKGLYEAGAISDELMSTCTPKDFYLLVPTIFDQSLKAFQAGIVALETLKSALQFLLDPSLLPSLVSGLGWAARKLWETKPSAPHLDPLLPLLTCLIKPTSLSPEASALHETVLTITSYPLERALAHVQKLHPRRRDIDPLLNALRPHLHHIRSGAATHTELETWSATPHSGLFSALRHSFQALTNWSLATQSKQENAGSYAPQAPSGSAPSYTHRLILACVRTFGAVATLSALLSETVKQITMGNWTAEVPLDVLTAFVCAPAVPSARSMMSLRQALQRALPDAYSYSVGKNGLQPDTIKAELLVHLSRRVETQNPMTSVVKQNDEGVPTAVGGADATGDMIIDLEASTALADGSLNASITNSSAPNNDVLDGMLKDVDTAGLEELMAADNSGGLFDLG